MTHKDKNEGVYGWLATMTLAALPLTLLAACAATPQSAVSALTGDALVQVPAEEVSAADGAVASRPHAGDTVEDVAALQDNALSAEASHDRYSPALLPLAVADSKPSDEQAGAEEMALSGGDETASGVIEEQIVEVQQEEVFSAESHDAAIQLALSTPSQPLYSPPPATVVFQFAFDSDMPSDNDLLHIEEHGAYLAAHPSLAVVVYGYADSQGDNAYNFALSGRRAERVADLLLGFGANPEQVDVHAYGEASAIGAPHASDRRVELEYVDVIGVSK